MQKLTKLLLLLAISFFSCSKTVEENSQPQHLFIKACDLSMLPEIRANGVMCKNLYNETEDMLETLKGEGLNTVRLRLWNNPDGRHSGFEEVKKFAQEIKNKGIKVWLTVHYSDTWADPSQQIKPKHWQKLTYNQLKDSVYAFTKKIMIEINPDFIQIGNEINSGFLHPEGSWSNGEQMIELLATGIKAVREQSKQTQIMLHYAGYEKAIYFYSRLKTLDYDLIALSYYPMWHGKNLDHLQAELGSISSSFNKKIIIAETAYPFTFEWNDWTNNIIGSKDQILPEFVETPEGQRDFMFKIKKIMIEVPNGIGFCYWGGEWIAFKGNRAMDGSSWENQALWNFTNHALPAIRVFN